MTYEEIRSEAIKQGWRIEPKRHGEMFLSPDGRSTAMWHRLHRSSDPNALKALVRDLRRGGFMWPPLRRGD
jgi:hypothetical protein